MTERDDYLWDRSGPPDPEIARLETWLAPLGLPGDAAPPVPSPRRRAPWWYLAGAAAAVLIACLWWAKGDPGGGAAGVEPRGDAPQLVRHSDRSVLRLGQRIETTESEILELGDMMSQITVEPGSVLFVERLDRDQARLRLERGRLHAFVAAEVKARFFQVQTPVVNCVDLGCEYTLAVDTEQTARVQVRSGRVAFEDRGREVVVPVGATCVATRAHGAGTPRHLDTPDPVVRFLDTFDANPGTAGAAVRLRMARRILALLDGMVDRRLSLIPWHFLQDPNHQVQRLALDWLQHNRGAQAPRPGKLAGTPVSPDRRQAWRDRLEPDWGW